MRKAWMVLSWDLEEQIEVTRSDVRTVETHSTEAIPFRNIFQTSHCSSTGEELTEQK